MEMTSDQGGNRFGNRSEQVPTPDGNSWGCIGGNSPLAQADDDLLATFGYHRPSWQLDVVPQAGYRFDSYRDPRSGSRLPALIASVSSEQLFDTFLSLLEPLGDTCDVVLETSHEGRTGESRRTEFTREGIERLVLESVLWDFEDLLLNDGCTGIAIMHPELPMEVQLDEHKLLVVYAPNRTPFERILAEQGLDRDDRMRFISQGEHLHTSHTRFARQFDEMSGRFGATE